ncbi:MAG: hypothetical protein AAB506_02280 [Patescibacteria group bacterium]
MSISVLIVGANKKGREEEIIKKLADKPYTIKPQGDTIDDIRELQKQIHRRPAFGNYKAAVIPEAQNLSPEAQNSLLKTLEEPPEDTIIILTSPTTDLLLSTIVSRCQVISLLPAPEIELSPDQIIKLKKTDFKNIATREEALDFVEKLIFVAHHDLLKDKTQTSHIRKLIQARHYLKSNTNIKLTLESLTNLMPWHEFG